MELVRCGAYMQMNAGSLGGGLFDRRAAVQKGDIEGKHSFYSYGYAWGSDTSPRAGGGCQMDGEAE